MAGGYRREVVGGRDGLAVVTGRPSAEARWRKSAASRVGLDSGGWWARWQHPLGGAVDKEEDEVRRGSNADHCVGGGEAFCEAFASSRTCKNSCPFSQSTWPVPPLAKMKPNATGNAHEARLDPATGP